MRFGFGARDEIEMPPFRAQGFEPGLAHDPAQQFAVAPASGVSLPCFTISASLSIWANLLSNLFSCPWTACRLSRRRA